MLSYIINLLEVKNTVENSSEKLRQEAVNYINIGAWEKTLRLLDALASCDFPAERVKADKMYVRFWLARKQKYMEMDDHYKRGIFLFRQWKVFLDFINNVKHDEKVFFAVKSRIFSQALYSFSRFASESRISDASTLFNIGVCYKNMGNYAEAIRNLEMANARRNSDAAVLSELADCYEMTNESKAARIFFREAFYIDPQEIDLDSLESTMIHSLVKVVENVGYMGKILKEWIPVYGVLEGVFDMKRELKPLEIAQLRQAIVTLEAALNEKENQALNVPRLINKYLWLIDFYQVNGNNSGVIENTLKKIRDLNPAVYELYTN